MLGDLIGIFSLLVYKASGGMTDGILYPPAEMLLEWVESMSLFNDKKKRKKPN